MTRSTLTKARALAFAAYFYGVTLLFIVAGIPVRVFRPKAALSLAQAWVRTVLAGLRPICGISWQVTGQDHLPQGVALLASQHQSAFDTLIWMVMLKRPSYVMKQELTRIPLFGPLLLLSGMIAVDRDAGAPALRKLVKETGLAHAAARQIVIFPQGTRVPLGDHVALQPGIAAISARLRLPVIPVATDSGRFWPAKGGLWGMRGLAPGIIHIAIGPPIDPATRRPAMLSAIEGFWQEAENCSYELVDNSVGKVADPITAIDRRTG